MRSRKTQKRIDPIAQFMQEHDEMLMHLSSLNKATSSLAQDGFTVDAHNRVNAAMHFILQQCDDVVHFHFAKHV